MRFKQQLRQAANSPRLAYGPWRDVPTTRLEIDMGKLRTLGHGLGGLPTAGTGSLKNTNHRAKGQGATARGYTYRWEQYRLGYLQLHPFCVYCIRDDPDRLTVATVIDHIVPHQGNMNLFWQPTNHQALCKPCHDVVKAAEERALGYR